MPEQQRSTSSKIRVLVVDDNEGDIVMVQRVLRLDPLTRYAIESENTGQDAIARCIREPFDCMLLDHGLPDMDGLQVLDALEENGVYLPTVILTGSSDATIGIEAMRRGAQDYLDKASIETQLLRKSISYAIERLQVLRDRKRLLERRERELLSLERLSASTGDAESSNSSGAAPLRGAAIAEFQAFVARYADLLECAVERCVTDGDLGVSQSLRALSAELGAEDAGPQDVVDIYVTALRGQRRVTPEKADALAHEGRLLTLELMGYLVSFYRNRRQRHREAA